MFTILSTDHPPANHTTSSGSISTGEENCLLFESYDGNWVIVKLCVIKLWMTNFLPKLGTYKSYFGLE